MPMYYAVGKCVKEPEQYKELSFSIRIWKYRSRSFLASSFIDVQKKIPNTYEKKSSVVFYEYACVTSDWKITIFI